MSRTWALIAVLCSLAGTALLVRPYLGDAPIPVDRVMVASGAIDVPRAQAPGQKPLRFAIGAMISPRATFIQYARLAHMLSQELGRPVELVQRASYGETNRLVEAGEVDIAFVCSGAYVELARTSRVALLVAPVTDGRPSYWGEVIVPSGSPLRRLEDVRGTQGLRIAYTDRLSNTGCAAPRAMLRRVGVDPERHMARPLWTGSHDESVRAVAGGHVDLAGVDALILHAMLRADASLAGKIRVIARSDDFGAPPVVAAAHVSPAVRLSVAQALTGMGQTPQGRDILAELGVERFVPVSDDLYDGVRAVQPRHAPAGGP
ncbi:MAG: hypothetical protein AMXMBFR64_56940 [Myxococcales bacterium]